MIPKNGNHEQFIKDRYAIRDGIFVRMTQEYNPSMVDGT
jgi:hypothetical protein